MLSAIRAKSPFSQSALFAFIGLSSPNANWMADLIAQMAKLGLFRRVADGLDMSLDSQVKPRHLLVAAVALGAVVCLLLLRDSTRDGAVSSRIQPSHNSDIAAGHGSSRADSGPNPSPSTPAGIPLPQGGWKATGRVVWVAPNVTSDQPPGTVLERPWVFRQTCQRTCKIAFARGTLYGPSMTWLVKDGRFFTAKFPPVTVPCSYPKGSSYPRRLTGQSRDSYKLWWSSDHSRLHAIEHRLETGCYRTPGPPDVTRWQATRVSVNGALS